MNFYIDLVLIYSYNIRMENITSVMLVFLALTITHRVSLNGPRTCCGFFDVLIAPYLYIL
jgi:hypothetical protein